MFARFGRWCFVHHWRVVFGWVALLVIIFMTAGALGPGFGDELEVPDSETKSGFDIVDEYFGGLGSGRGGQLVIRSDLGIDDPEVQATIEPILAEVAEIEGVNVTSPYEPFGASQVATEGELAGQVAIATIELDSDIGQTEGGEIGTEIRALIPDSDNVEILVGGGALTEFAAPESELIGLAFAVVILIVAFGSVIAMGLPIATAVVGVGAGIGLTVISSNAITIPQFATTLGAMIGLGVGIDYSLFIVTRYREGLHKGRSSEDATAVAMDTAGRAVLFAGVTVVISMLGLLIIGLSFVTGLSVSAALTVLVTMIASLTLMPALFAIAGDRIEQTRWRGLIAAGFVALSLLFLGIGFGGVPALAAISLAVITMLAGMVFAPLKRRVPTPEPKPLRESFWYRFSRVVQGHPWTMALGGAGILILLALPVFGMRLGFSDEGNFAEETDTRQAYDLTSEAFGPGYNGPFAVAVEFGEDDPAAIDELVEVIAATEGVASVEGPFPNDFENPEAALIRVTPDFSPQDVRTEELVVELRDEIIPAATEDIDHAVFLTGFTAASVDFTQYLSSRMLIFIAVVLAMSFLLLMAVFRSLLVPLKAVVMNLLSIGAAYGLMVVVFQWGWLSDLVGVEGGAPIEPFLPMMMFAIVFGLSMDYEVFLLSRIKEEYDKTGDAVNSVADGLAATARVITAAAMIMVVVFGSFVFETDRVIKVFGFGLAVAVFLDATLVRMILVPATMELLGDKNWWLPGWLDRILPNIHVEGHEDELDSDGPEPPDGTEKPHGSEPREPIPA